MNNVGQIVWMRMRTGRHFGTMALSALLIILLSLSILSIRPTALGGPPGAPANSGTFVKACGLSLCLAGRVWHMYLASTYGGLQDPDLTTSLAAQGHLNTVRIDDFLDSSGAPSAGFDEAHWRKVDKMIASARSKGLHVLLDLSVYRNLSNQNGAVNPYLVDWKPFLTFVTRRVNTVTRVRYADDPTIALVSLAGEVAPPNGSGNNLHVTTQQINTFFARTSAEFNVLDVHHLLSPGGQYQLNWNSGIDWKTIFALPGIDVCAVHAPPDGADPVLTATYCKAIHKPWIWEEFSQAQEIGDQVRANYYQAVYDKARQYGAAGVGFWNLGPGTQPYSSDVNPNTPLTWHVVVQNAPAVLSRATGAPHGRRPRKAYPATHGHDNRHGQHDSTRPYRITDTFARPDQVGWGTIGAKVWPVGAPEPASWMVTAVDSSPLAANLVGTGGRWDLPGNGESIRYVCYRYATSGLADTPAVWKTVRRFSRQLVDQSVYGLEGADHLNMGEKGGKCVQ